MENSGQEINRFRFRQVALSTRGPEWLLFQALTRYFVGAQGRLLSLERIETGWVIIGVVNSKCERYEKFSRTKVIKSNTVFLSQKVIHPTNLALDTLPQITSPDKHNRHSPLYPLLPLF